MVANLANFACETSASPGTATTVNLAGPVTGRPAIGLDFTSGQSGYWVLEDGTQQEISYGAYTSGSPNTIARTTVLWNSSVGHATPSRLNFSGSTYVYSWPAAERSLYVDTAGFADLRGFPLGTYGMQVQRGYLQGMELTRASGTTLTGAIGIAADDVNRNGYITFQAQKTLNFGTTGAGGLDTGTFTSSQTYHVFAIGQADGTSALFASLSLTPTLPGSYVFRRRIGAVLSLAGPVLFSWVQVGDEFWLYEPYEEFYGTTGDELAHTIALARVPAGIVVKAMLTALAYRYFFYVSALALTDVTGDVGSSVGRGSGSDKPRCECLGVFTNTSRQIRYRASSASWNMGIYNVGWVDRRGRDG